MGVFTQLASKDGCKQQLADPVWIEPKQNQNLEHSRLCPDCVENGYIYNIYTSRLSGVHYLEGIEHVKDAQYRNPNTSTFIFAQF